MSDEHQSVRRLPLWKSCLDDMRVEGINYGKRYSAEFFEEKLSAKRDTVTFGIAVSEIRRALEKDGFYLSGQGQKGEWFVIIPPSANVDVMASYSKAATDALARGVILGTSTPLDTLSSDEKRRHESMLEKMARKLQLVKKSKQIYDAVKKTSPKLME